jgi:hypothetical protein
MAEIPKWAATGRTVWTGGQAWATCDTPGQAARIAEDMNAAERYRVALEEITHSHPALVTRGGGPAPWLVAKAALLNIAIDVEEVIHQWRKTEPRVGR